MRSAKTVAVAHLEAQLWSDLHRDHMIRNHGRPEAPTPLSEGPIAYRALGQHCRPPTVVSSAIASSSLVERLAGAWPRGRAPSLHVLLAELLSSGDSADWLPAGCRKRSHLARPLLGVIPPDPHCLETDWPLAHRLRKCTSLGLFSTPPVVLVCLKPVVKYAAVAGRECRQALLNLA